MFYYFDMPLNYALSEFQQSTRETLVSFSDLTERVFSRFIEISGYSPKT